MSGLEHPISTGGCGNPLCAICASASEKQPRPLNDILVDIEQAAKNKASTILFPDHELLLHPQWKIILATCVKLGLPFQITTSWLGIASQRTLNNLIKLGLSGVRYLLASLTPEVNQLVWGDWESHQRSLNILDMLLGGNVPIQITIPVTPYNRGELERTLMEVKLRYRMEATFSDQSGNFSADIERARKRASLRWGRLPQTRPGRILFRKTGDPRPFDPASCTIKWNEDPEAFDPRSVMLQVNKSSWQQFDADAKADLEDIVLSKNLRGLISLYKGEQAIPYRIHDVCKTCQRLTTCGAAFIPSEMPVVATTSSECLHPADLFKAETWKLKTIVVGSRSTVCQAIEPGAIAPKDPGPAWEPWEVADIAKMNGLGIEDYNLDRDPVHGSWQVTLGKNAPSLFRGDGALAVLQLSSACVARCIMCSLPQMFKGKWVDSASSTRLLEELKLLGYDTCDTFGGEITLRHDFLTLMMLAKEIGLRVMFITTGHNLTQERVKTLADAGVDKCSIALDSTRSELHDMIKNRPGLHAQALEAIRLVLEDGRIPLEINSVVLRHNVHELVDLHSMLADMGVHRHRLFYCIDGLFGMGDPPYLTYDQAITFIKEIHPRLTRISQEKGTLIDWCPPVDMNAYSLEEQAERLSKGIYTDTSVTCTAPGREIYVMVDGSIYPCVNPTIWKHDAIGKVGQDRLIDIERGDLLNHFKSKAGSLQACANCISKRS